MPRKITSTQGQAWDQIARDRLGSELRMGAILPVNVAELDALQLPGGVTVVVPDADSVEPASTAAPWERL